MVQITKDSPQVHKDRRDWYNLRSMLPFLWEFRGRALFALSCLVLSKAANVGVPIVLKDIIEHFEQAKAQELTLISACFVARGIRHFETQLELI